MDYDTLMQDVELRKIRKRLNALRDDGKLLSDVVDDQGRQYVDLVMEGGGTLGLALAGYIWALEEAGVRFLGVGGTSAGSIAAMLVATLANPQERKSPALFKALGNVDFIDFVDGGWTAKRLADALSAGRTLAAIGWGAVRGVNLLLRWRKTWGINDGDAFERWLCEVLDGVGITSVEALEKRLTTVPPGLRLREAALSPEQGPRGWKLAIVAADVATETKVVFPRMGELYFDTATVHPARFVRASMSIPLFFKALRPELPRPDGYQQRWDDTVGTRLQQGEELPRRAILVDGGIMSNFPISEFRVRGTPPHRPTLGVKLGTSGRVQQVGGLFSFLLSLFNSARRVMDYDFLRRNPDYRQLVAYVDTSGYNWLKFSISQEEQTGLIRAGARTALDFLEAFDWEKYKSFRTAMAVAEQREMGTIGESVQPPAATG